MTKVASPRGLMDTLMTRELLPGMLVRHPSQPDWGLGQIQSVVGERVTVNFEHRGKQLINCAVIALEIVAKEQA